MTEKTPRCYKTKTKTLKHSHYTIVYQSTDYTTTQSLDPHRTNNSPTTLMNSSNNIHQTPTLRTPTPNTQPLNSPTHSSRDSQQKLLAQLTTNEPLCINPPKQSKILYTRPNQTPQHTHTESLRRLQTRTEKRPKISKRIPTRPGSRNVTERDAKLCTHTSEQVRNSAQEGTRAARDDCNEAERKARETVTLKL